VHVGLGLLRRRRAQQVRGDAPLAQAELEREGQEVHPAFARPAGLERRRQVVRVVREHEVQVVGFQQAQAAFNTAARPAFAVFWERPAPAGAPLGACRRGDGKAARAFGLTSAERYPIIGDEAIRP